MLFLCKRITYFDQAHFRLQIQRKQKSVSLLYDPKDDILKKHSINFWSFQIQFTFKHKHIKTMMLKVLKLYFLSYVLSNISLKYSKLWYCIYKFFCEFHSQTIPNLSREKVRLWNQAIKAMQSLNRPYSYLNIKVLYLFQFISFS